MNKGQAEVSMCSNRNTKQTLRARRTEKLNTAWSSGGESRWAGWRFKCRSLALPFLFPLMRLHQQKKPVQINSSLANIWATCWTEVSEAKPSYIPALEHKWLAALYISNTPSNFNGSSPEHTALSDRTQRRASSIHLRTGVGDAIKLICLLTLAEFWIHRAEFCIQPRWECFQRHEKHWTVILTSFWSLLQQLVPCLGRRPRQKTPKRQFLNSSEPPWLWPKSLNPSLV